ncbi:wd repeat-containing protein [Anaeramoeba flamelloides]|uniref:Wd repeat-containing protein n=1 Tax=Anaeramoeba flamelloides TaxID=1746091 RepID=A0ABQ8YU41_9EUKA|nr:wd repeat-containing protein [Anaeramoeba flamelloides]
MSLVVLSSSLEGIFLWSLNDGTVIKHYKTGTPVLSLTNKGFVSIQSSKPRTLQHFSYQIQSSIMKSSLPVIPTALVSTSGSEFLFVGDTEGKIYIWHVPTGRLLNFFSAHFREITCLKLTNDECHLISAGKDSVVSCWKISEILQGKNQSNDNYDFAFDDEEEENDNNNDNDNGASEQFNQQKRILPVHKWADHTLEVTTIFCTPQDKIITGSLDRTCKIYDLGCNGELLGSLLLPSMIRSVTADNCETALWVGCDNGHIYQIELKEIDSVRKIRNTQRTSFLVSSNLKTTNSEEQNNEGNSNEKFEQISEYEFYGHEFPLISLACSPDGTILVSGDSSGAIRIWDITTRQTISLFKKHSKKIVSINFVDSGNLLLQQLVQQKHKQQERRQFKKKGHSNKKNIKLNPRITQPIVPLKKHSLWKQDEVGLVPILLKSDSNYHQKQYYEKKNWISEIQKQKSYFFPQKNNKSEDNQEQIENELKKKKKKNIDVNLLLEELERVKNENQRWKIINNQLYKQMISVIVPSKK